MTADFLCSKSAAFFMRFNSDSSIQGGGGEAAYIQVGGKGKGGGVFFLRLFLYMTTKAFHGRVDTRFFI